MKKILYMLFLSICAMGLFTGCQKSLSADSDTVYVQKKGGIISVLVDEFDKDYYKEDELKSFVEEKVKDYTAQNEKNSVKVDKFTVSGKTAQLHMSYAGYEDYANFNEVEFFAGMVSEALVQGYDFKTDISTVINEKKEGIAKAEDITGNSDHKVIILTEKIDVKVDGQILYVSSEDTKITGKDSVKIETKEKKDYLTEPIYIVYK